MDLEIILCHAPTYTGRRLKRPASTVTLYRYTYYGGGITCKCEAGHAPWTIQL
ncbi:hypothetical protein M1M40_gp70 [Halorubrum tailed virus 29]|uniref:Uncharacterized protein n=1 Tax=Halorubrum tailed virus 29 TaxID=2878010 RepID=A0AAE9BYP0_9CAUD|nr:hypothetical protein M1M40_gp70 [Halorubrum tailed virus 29]UBF23348.1 hypothetical protein HRTV-29_gp70 [Halorubrum tailed virus 29]